MKQIHTQNFNRKRKFFLVLPILVCPFLTLGFWALGGGKKVNQGEIIPSVGLNTKLPDARQDQEFTNKLSFYNQAVRDSIKLAESIKKDPYYTTDPRPINQSTLPVYPDALNKSPGIKRETQSSEKQLMDKLAMLQEQLQEPPPRPKSTARFLPNKTHAQIEEEKLYSGSITNQNPQLKQMEGMLDKILDIQHPERVKNKLLASSTDSGHVYSLTTRPMDENHNGFYGIPTINDDAVENAFEAVIHQTQSIATGSVVKMRLVSDLFIDSMKISKGNFLFGFAALNQERLEIAIHSIKVGQSIFPVHMQVYDQDGLSGIYIPGAISRDVTKQSVDNNLQLLQLSTMDPSLKAQAAAAGIQTAKSFLSKKVKVVKVVLKSGYRILLKNKS